MSTPTPSSGLPSPAVHRTRLTITDVQTVRMPAGATLLHVAGARLGVGPHAQPVIDVWYHANVADAPLVERAFRIIGTGVLADVPPDLHIGTVIFDDRSWRDVWHVFDLLELVDGRIRTFPATGEARA